MHVTDETQEGKHPPADPSNEVREPRTGVCRSLDDAEAYTQEPKRRLRYLIACHGFPMRKVAGKYQGFYSEIDRWYAERLG